MPIALRSIVVTLGLLSTALCFEGLHNEATVKINVVDLFGRPLPYRVASFIRRSDNKDLSRSFSALTGKAIPAGAYRYRLERTDFLKGSSWLAGDIEVASTDITKTILGEGTLASVEGRPATITVSAPKKFHIGGKITNIPPEATSVWLRLQSVYQDHHVDVAVDNSGEFSIGEPLYGTYTALVIDRGVVLALQLVSFDQGVGLRSRLDITLSGPVTPSIASPNGQDH
jgi:hypothetical protein